MLASLLVLHGALSEAPADLKDKVEKKPLPSGPILKKAPEFAQWTATFVYPKKPNAPVETSGAPSTQRRLKIQYVTKTKDIYEEQEFYTDGSKSERWRIGQLEIISASNGYSLYDRASVGGAAAQASLFNDYSKTDFPALGWVSPRNYIGVQRTNEAEYLIFQQVVSEPELTLGPSSSLLTACIDTKTRLPVWIQGPDATITYRFGNPPANVLTLPSNIQQLLDQRAKVIKQLTTITPSF